jgi:uncharacterized protein DUF4391
MHRAVPYPVWLVMTQVPRLTLSLAHKRWSQGVGRKTVLAGEVTEVRLDAEHDDEVHRRFLDALPLARQPRSTLHAPYQGWVDSLLALQAARVTGRFALPMSASTAAARQEALREHARLQSEMAALRTQAGRERQVSRRVEINLAVCRLETLLAAVRGLL